MQGQGRRRSRETTRSGPQRQQQLDAGDLRGSQTWTERDEGNRETAGADHQARDDRTTAFRTWPLSFKTDESRPEAAFLPSSFPEGGGNRKIPQVDRISCPFFPVSRSGQIVDHFLQDLSVLLS